jgi:hypothetical protein
MWKPQHFTTLWASMACYKSSFTFPPPLVSFKPVIFKTMSTTSPSNWFSRCHWFGVLFISNWPKYWEFLYAYKLKLHGWKVNMKCVSAAVNSLKNLSCTVVTKYILTLVFWLSWLSSLGLCSFVIIQVKLLTFQWNYFWEVSCINVE